MKRNFLYLPAILALCLLFQCVGQMPTKIADIRDKPRSYADKEIFVAGEVTKTFSLIIVKYFTLRDSTGEIMVVTERTLPEEGEHLKVRGKVREAFSIGSERLLVIVEEPERDR
jgi:hypothetical protein